MIEPDTPIATHDGGQGITMLFWPCEHALDLTRYIEPALASKRLSRQ